MTATDPIRPRARNAAATRSAILAAASRQFARESYENVGLREISREVGVDPALIARYFGSKEELFREVLDGVRDKTMLEGVAAADLPARLASLIVDMPEDREEEEAKFDRLLIILRSASSPNAGAIVNDVINADFLGPIVALLDGEDARLRASLTLSVLIGSVIVRNMMSVMPSCDGDHTLLRARLTGLFEEALGLS